MGFNPIKSAITSLAGESKEAADNIKQLFTSFKAKTEKFFEPAADEIRVRDIAREARSAISKTGRFLFAPREEDITNPADLQRYGVAMTKYGDLVFKNPDTGKLQAVGLPIEAGVKAEEAVGKTGRAVLMELRESALGKRGVSFAKEFSGQGVELTKQLGELAMKRIPKDGVVQAIKRSIQAGEKIKPLMIVRESNGLLNVVDGVNRLQALKELGHKTANVADITKEFIEFARGNFAKDILQRGIVKDINFKQQANEFIGNIRKSKIPKQAVKALEDITKRTGADLHQRQISLKRIDKLSNSPFGGEKIIEQILDLPEGGLASEVRKAGKNFLDDIVNINNTIEQRMTAAEGLSRVRAETGRAVVQFRDPVTNARIIKEALKSEIDRTTDPIKKKALQKILDLSKVTNSVPNMWDKIIEATTASKLTSPLTFVRNAVGNTLARIISPVEKTLAGTFSTVESTVSRQKQKRFIAEGVADVFGAVRGTGSAVKKFWAGLLDEGITQRSFKAAEVSRKGPAISGIKGKIIRAPFRLLGAADEAFREIGRSSEIHSLAYRKAKQEALSGSQLWARIDELIKNPTKQMIIEAEKKTMEAVFQKNLGKLAGGFQKFLNIKGNPLKIVVPFFKTPINLFKFSFQRGQLGFLSPRNITEIIKGGQGVRSESLARVAMGQITGAYLAWQAIEGNITGRGPSDFAERRQLMRTGWRPFSIKLQDKSGNTRYLSYRGFEPLSQQLSLAAEIAEQTEDKTSNIQERITKLVSGITRNMADQPFATGIKQMLDAFEDPEKSASTFLEQTLSGFVPTGLGFLENTIDPTLREATGVKERILSKTPGLSNTLPVKFDFLGDPIVNEGGLLQRISPSKISTEKIDIIDKTLKQLDIKIPVIPKKIDGVELTSKERSITQRDVGTIIKNNLSVILDNPQFPELPENMQKKILEKQISTIQTDIVKSRVRLNSQLREIGLTLSPEQKTKIFPLMRAIMRRQEWKNKDNAGKTELIQQLLAR